MSRIAAQVQKTSEKLQREHSKTLQSISNLMDSFHHSRGSANEDSQTEMIQSENLDFLDSTREYNDGEILDFLESTTRELDGSPHALDGLEPEEQSFFANEESLSAEIPEVDNEPLISKQKDVADELDTRNVENSNQAELNEEFEQILADELIQTSSESKKKDIMIDEMRDEIETLKLRFQTTKASPSRFLIEDRRIMQLEDCIKHEKQEIKHLKQLCNEKDEHFRQTFKEAEDKFKVLSGREHVSDNVNLKAEVLDLRRELAQAEQTAISSTRITEVFEQKLKEANSNIEDLKREKSFCVSKELYQQLENDIHAKQGELEQAFQSTGKLEAKIKQEEAEIGELTKQLQHALTSTADKEDECESLQSKLIAAEQEKQEMQLQSAEVEEQLTASERQRECVPEFECLTPQDEREEEIDRLTDIVEDLRSKLENTGKEAVQKETEQETRISQLERFIDELQKVNEELEAQCSNLECQLVSVENDKDAISTALIRKCSEFDSINAEHAELADKYERVSSEAAESKNLAAQARIMSDRYKEEKQKAEKALRIQIQEFQQQMKLLEDFK